MQSFTKSGALAGLLLLTCLPVPLAANANDPLGDPYAEPSFATDPAALLFAPAGFTFHSKHGADGSGSSQGWTPGRPDGHAPIGVMGDHVHKKGEWMVSLRAMRMHMDGMRQGTDRLSSAEVIGQGFMVTPTEMDMTMLMAGLMYAPSDNVTLMAMLPYVWNEMDHITGTNVEFTTRSSGISDLRLTGLVPVARFGEREGGGQIVHLNLGLSVPTGSIDERDDTPAMAGATLPYPMQLGTGTWDLLPGVTYNGQADDWSWGAQVQGRFHLGRNDEDYRRGNRGEATVWGARRITPGLSSSVRLAGQTVGNISGRDLRLNPNMVPTADPGNQGGKRLDLLVGLNAYLAAGHRGAFEVGLPVYQDLDGPQLETDWTVTLGWQFSW